MWRRVGRELATLVAGPEQGGSRILLVRAGEKTSVGPEQNAIEQSLRDALGTREITVVILPNQPRSPDQVAAKMPDLPQGVRADWLSGELGQHGAATTVVSLSGEPAGVPAAGVKWPPVICFAPAAQTGLTALVRSGVVIGAVAQRHDVPKRGEDDWFSLRYTVLRKDNIATW